MNRVLAGIAATALLVTVCRAQDDASAVSLERARLLVRQGSLKDAEALLIPLVAEPGGAATDTVRAHGELLLGNIAFERGAFEAARRHYAVVLQDPDASEGLHEAARANSDRAGTLLHRRESLDRAADRLAMTAAVVGLVGGATCLWLARRAASHATGR